MLFKRSVLDGFADGAISLAFRRWERPRVRVGSRLRTAVGVLEVDAVDEVDVAEITVEDARRAGFSSRHDLFRALDQRADGSVYRVELHMAGSDPRVALRGRRSLTDSDLAEVQQRLARLDAAGRHGSWTKSVLRLIRDRPGVRAADLARKLGRERLAFKRDVRAEGAGTHGEPRGRIPAVAARTCRPRSPPSVACAATATKGAAMTFRGWPAEAIEFYEGLEADNSKTYWQENKAVYEEIVRGPMDELLAELAPEFGEGRIFRPYRDVRFSKDKSPYKTSIAATLARGGYIQFSAEGLGAGSGMYMMAPDQLDRYRRAVADERKGRELVALVDKTRRRRIEVTGHDVLKTAPKGYPKDHPRIELLRNKGLICWKQWPVGAWLGTRKAKDRVVEFLRASQPLKDWLEKRVGPSEMETER